MAETHEQYVKRMRDYRDREEDHDPAARRRTRQQQEETQAAYDRARARA